MNKRIHIEKFTDAKAADLANLFNEVFRQKVPVQYLREKYSEDRLGSQHYSFIAYDKNKPVAFLGAIPQRFVYHDENFLSVQTCDYITLPSWRGQGIHTALVRASLDEMESSGVAFHWGFFTEGSGPTAKRFGWNISTPFNAYTVPISNPILSALRRSISKGGSTKFIDEIFPNPYRHSDHLSAKYDKDWLRYKSFSPNRIFEAENPMWIRERKDIWVGAIEVKQPESFPGSLLRLRNHASARGYQKIEFLAYKNSQLDILLAPFAKKHPTWDFAYAVFDKNVPIEKLKVNLADLDSF